MSLPREVSYGPLWASVWWNAPTFLLVVTTSVVTSTAGIAFANRLVNCCRCITGSGFGFESGEDLCQVLDGGAGIDDADSHGGAAIEGGWGEQGGAVVQ